MSAMSITLAPEPTACRFCESGLFKFEFGMEWEEVNHLHRLAASLPAKLFHEPCTQCQSTGSENLEPTVLCDFCKHLRLRHLFCCVDSAEAGLENAFFRFCRFEDIPARASCSFCRLILRSVMPYSYFSGLFPASRFEGGFLSFNIQDDRMLTRFYYHNGSSARGEPIYHNGLSQTERGKTKMQQVRNIYGSNRVGFESIPRVGRHIDWALAARWLADCRAGHERCAGPGFGTLPAKFRVIDIAKRRLVQAEPDCPYVALSYVWGTRADPFSAKMSNIEALREDGGLPVHKEGNFDAPDVPATVEDAMEVCRRLGENYLWVDRFCIIQNDDEDKAEQVVAMATIYSRARFVIINTDGDSDSGIPGIGRERSQAQICERISGVELINSTSGWQDIIVGASRWSTRGWTYQEAILARRKIYLTEAQAFFECENGVTNEDGSYQQAKDLEYALRPVLPQKPLIQDWFAHVGKYRTRSLTDASDIYNAIDGIATALYGRPGSLWCGLPRQDFDHSLLWCTDSDGRSGPSSDGTSPSWSWSAIEKSSGTSWSRSATNKGIPLLDTYISWSLNYYDTLVAWASCRSDGLTRRLESVETVSGKPLAHLQLGESCGCPATANMWVTEQLVYVAIAWTQGCIHKACPFARPEETTFSAFISLVASRWACHHRYWLDVFRGPTGIEDGAAFHSWTPEELDQAKGLLAANPNVIVTLAQCASFHLQGTMRGKTSLGNLAIIDEKDWPVGVLIGWEIGLDHELAPEVEAGERFEFIALSMSSVKDLVQEDGDVERVSRYQFQPSTADSSDEEGDPSSPSSDGDSPVYMPEPGSSPGPGPAGPGAESESCSSSETEARKVTFRDSKGISLFPLPVVNVMLIRRGEGGIARRVSVGWIYLTAWTRARPEFRPVYLG